jgi:branched-subunit amino acid transport protein
VDRTWIAVLVLGASCYALRALGPLAIAGRTLPATIERSLELLLPALLAALVAVQAFGGPRGGVRLDPRLAGIAAALVVLRIRGGMLGPVIAGAATTALLRLLL